MSKKALCIGANHPKAEKAFDDAERASALFSAAGYDVTLVRSPAIPDEYDIVWFSGEADPEGGLAADELTFDFSTLRLHCKDDGWLIFDCCHIGSKLCDHGRVNALGCLGLNPNEAEGSMVSRALQASLPSFPGLPLCQIVPQANALLRRWVRTSAWMYEGLELVVGRL